ncbi:MAG: 50S ribosomal protein L21e [Thermoplasmata archaeon]|nr:50S ribosomal protein L21e [Thermoplasmatales archaeon]PMP74339.1 MAG: 50S ribosomal protein L21e [Aciduliprofundum sp.]
MSKMSHGPRARSGMKLMKGVRERGMPPITRFLREFQVGERVAIDIDPSQHSGMPHHRFQGRVGIVIGMQGRAYLVEVKEGSVRKVIIASPVHLKKVQ